MSTEPSDDDVKNAQRTSELLSGLIEMGFSVNHNIPPMPPYPAIPLKNLQKLGEESEALCAQLIAYAKQLRKHMKLKKLEAGALVSLIGDLEVHAVGITYQRGRT